MTLEHRGVLCELRSHDQTLIRPFRELSRTGDVVRAEVRMEQRMQYTFSWRALEPIDAMCIVKAFPPKGRNTSVIAVVFMQSEHPDTQICDSRKFLDHIDRLVGLEYLKCPRSDDTTLGGARLEIWKGCSPDIRKERPYITFDFNFTKEGNFSESEDQNTPQKKCNKEASINRWALHIKSRFSAHEDTMIADTPLSTSPTEVIRTQRSSRSNPIPASQEKPLASEPFDLPTMTLENGASEGLKVQQDNQLQSNDSMHELKESNDLLEERLEAEIRKIDEEERALKLKVKQQDLERRKQALNQERRDLEFDAPAQKRQKLSE